MNTIVMPSLSRGIEIGLRVLSTASILLVVAGSHGGHAQSFSIDSGGRRCLSQVSGSSTSIGGGKYQYNVKVENVCGQTIYVRVCYVGGSCSMVTAGPQKVSHGILGTGNNDRFDFEYSEVH